jgi:hypothetical protein
VWNGLTGSLGRAAALRRQLRTADLVARDIWVTGSMGVNLASKEDMSQVRKDVKLL